jgi:hypothetical protein
MRRFILGLLTAFLCVTAWPGQLAAEAKCYWVEVGRVTTYHLYSGEIEMTIYYRYFCDGQLTPP